MRPRDRFFFLTKGFRYLFWLLLIGCFCSVVGRIVSELPDQPYYTRRMAIDSETFVSLAKEMIEKRFVVMPIEGNHSPAMQLVAAFWLRTFPQKTFLTFKLFNAAVWVLTLVCLAVVLRRLGWERKWIGVGVLLLATSQTWSVYTAIFQPEILISFLFTLFFALTLYPSSPRRALGLGCLLATLPIFRAPYVLLFPAYFAYEIIFSDRKNLGWLIAGYGSLAVAWNGYLSWDAHAPYFYLNVRGNFFQHHLHAQANPGNYPVVAATVGPRGDSFIYSHPVEYALLTLERFRYLVGWRADIWFQESIWAAALRRVGLEKNLARVAIAVAGGALVVGGWWAGMGARSVELRRAAALAGILLAVVFFPHFFVGASTRFLVPIIPVLAFLQTLALRRWGMPGENVATAP